MAHDLNEADRKILLLLIEGRDEDRPWGRDLPSNLADDMDYSRQYIQSRLQLLSAGEFLDSIGGGLRELTEKGVEAAEEIKDN